MVQLVSTTMFLWWCSSVNSFTLFSTPSQSSLYHIATSQSNRQKINSNIVPYNHQAVVRKSERRKSHLTRYGGDSTSSDSPSTSDRKTLTQTERGVEKEKTTQKSDSVICGGGPAGLLSAIMLAQKFPSQKVKVYDRLLKPPSPTSNEFWNDNVAKFYLIGLGGRGQEALQKFGVWDDVLSFCTPIVGRKDWSPESDEGVERIFKDRPITTQVLPRDKLVGVLYEHIVKNYNEQIELNYGYEVIPVDFSYKNNNEDTSSVLVRISKCPDTVKSITPTSVTVSNNGEPESFFKVKNRDIINNDSFLLQCNLLIGSDGTARTIANYMEKDDFEKNRRRNVFTRIFNHKPFKVKRYVDDNQRIYKTVPMKLPSNDDTWRHDINYSARSKGGRVTFDALPANPNGLFCGVLLLKKNDEYAQAETNPAELRLLFDETLPQFSSLIDDDTMKNIAKKAPSFIPSFRYVTPRLHQGKHTVLIGDCAHTVKPYFGLGANSALEDVTFLSDAIDSTDNMYDAIRLFSSERAREAKALVRLSRELDRPGALGFATFILPLILDSIFHKIMPKFFQPNIIVMLQREGTGFCDVARRKRLDRLNQVILISTVLTSLGICVRTSINMLSQKFGVHKTTATGGIASATCLFFFFKRFAKYLIPGMAPADVLNKTKSEITYTQKEDFLWRKKKQQ